MKIKENQRKKRLRIVSLCLCLCLLPSIGTGCANSEDDNLSIVYQRKAGGYGLIVTDDEE